jgi:hypothetical protein
MWNQQNTYNLVGKLQHKRPFHHSAILICHCPLRCEIALTRQHIIIFPMFKSETSSLSQLLAGHKERKPSFQIVFNIIFFSL